MDIYNMAMWIFFCRQKNILIKNIFRTIVINNVIIFRTRSTPKRRFYCNDEDKLIFSEIISEAYDTD